MDEGAPLHALSPEQSAREWDDLKERIRRVSLVLQRDKRAAATLCYRTRIKRLRSALDHATEAAGTSISDRPPTMEVVTDGVESLALDPARRITSIRDERIAIKTAGSTARRRQHTEAHAEPAHMTSKAFFRRISKQYRTARQDSLPVQPSSTATGADQLAADWRPINQRPPCDPELQDEFFSKLPPAKEAADFSALNNPFMVAEVQEAIAVPQRQSKWTGRHPQRLVPGIR